MPQPTPFHRSFSFNDFQAGSPSEPLPGYRVDAQLDAIETTLGGVLGNLALIQRDDGMLADGVVTADALTLEALQAIAAEVPDAPPPPDFTFEVHALAPGAAATLAVTGVYPDLHLNFGIPKGDPSPGGTNVTDADYGDVAVSGGGSVFTVQTVGGEAPYRPSNKPAVADVTGLAAVLAAKQDDLTFGHTAGTDVLTKADGDALYQEQGTYATTAQLEDKADALTTVQSFNVDQAVSDATHNGTYNRMTGATGRTITFGAGPSAGHASIWVNRGTVNMTISCAGGYFKNGGASAAANLTLAPNGKLTAFHEGGGVWTFEGTGF